MRLTDEQIESLIQLGKLAGDAVMNVYTSGDFSVEHKGDKSPLTRADTASHLLLSAGLESLFPDIPILSEEGEQYSYEERKEREYFRSVDPLDGTKEFIKKNDEFAICIGLIKNNTPVFGMVVLPAMNMVYRGGVEYGVYKKKRGEHTIEITRSTKQFHQGDELVLIGSRSHRGVQDEQFAALLQERGYTISFQSAGSAYKFCKLLDSEADIYPRFKPTMEWDTAAGHAMVVALGWKIYCVDDNNGSLYGNQLSLVYNKSELRNFGFVVIPEQFESL